MFDFDYARDRMIEAHVIRRGVTEPRLIGALRQVPREAFVGHGLREFAYEDTALSIGEGQTISQPFIVALMIEQAGIAADDVILEIGTGSGYAAAVASRLARQVYTIERISSLAREAEERFQGLGFDNIHVRIGDGTRGWPEAVPFVAILVAAGGPSVPQTLKEQLVIGGRLILPVGSEDEQRLVRITRTGAATFEELDLGGVCFVPLIGEEGWRESPMGTLSPARSLP